MTRAAAAAIALATAVAASCAEAATATATMADLDGGAGPLIDQPALFTPDDVLLLAVTSDQEPISDGLEAYSSRAGVFIPLGELARSLDLAIVVDPAKQRAEGWVGSPDNRVRIDLRTRRATAKGEDFGVSTTEANFYQDEIYVRLDLLEKLLPLGVKVDLSGLTMSLKPKIALPYQQRLERARRRANLEAREGEAQPILQVTTPYEAFTPPSIDVDLQATAGNEAPKSTTRYEVRAAGDLLWAGMQFLASSDDRGELADMRILLERKDPQGRIAGPFGATRSAVGDTFTPSLPLGARSAGGRGFAITSAPLEQASVFERIDLRGELPTGYQAELYVNEVLRASQAEPVQGRYEFRDVGLAYGLNVVRVVFFGPRGERREEIRRINLNGGALQKGQFAYSIGAVEEGLTVFGVSESDQRKSLGSGLPLLSTPGFGRWRYVGAFGYGVATGATITAGFAQYTPRPNDTRQVAALGVVTSLDRLSLQLDASRDDKGGTAVGVGAAGRAWGVSVVARHAEYSGGFIDEGRPAAVGLNANLVRSSEVLVDMVQRIGDEGLPISMRLSRDEISTGERRLQASLRASRAVNRYLVSSSLDYQGVSGGPAASSDRLQGSTEISGLVAARWQVRGGVNYSVHPDPKLQSAVFVADRAIGQRSALHLGVNHAFDGNQTSFQVGQTWRLAALDLSLNGAYTTKSNDVRVGVQLTFGLTPNPYRSNRYRPIGPGATTGGAVAVKAFVDANADGQPQTGERALPDLQILGGRRGATTDNQGVGVVTGLGDGASAQVIVDMNTIEDPYLVAPPQVISLVPRPGRVAKAPYPLTAQGEVELRMQFQRGDVRRGLSALQVQLLDAKGQVAAEGRTEFDGTLIVEGLRPGAYSLRLDPEQAGRLGLALEEAPEIVVPPAGGFVGQRTIMVVRRGAVPPPPVPQPGD